MKTFASLLALAAFASAFDCTTLTDPASAPDCAAFPELAELLDGSSIAWRAIPVTTSDQYKLTMVRIEGTASGAAVPSRGPLVLHHGRFSDAREWFENPADSLPARLADAGFDVYLTNKRGSSPSRDHVTLDPNSADFWDFTFDDIGDKDLTAFVSAVLATRATAGLPCERVQILTAHVGAQETLLMLANNPASSQNYVERVVTIGSCHSYSKQQMVNFIEGGDVDDRRMLRHWDPWSPPSFCSRREYYAELRRIKYEVLTYQQYKDFYKVLKRLKQDKYGFHGPDESFYCDGNWRELVEEALCKIDSTQPVCVPPVFAKFDELLSYARDTCNVVSLFGPDFETQL